MRKIVAFIASPRKNSFSTQLLRQVCAGAQAAGAEVVTYDLNADGVKGCQSCFYCRSHEGCAARDTLQPMYQDIKEADGIVATFPMYFGSINGQAKLWLDRMYPMIGPEGPRYPGKKAVTIFSQGAPDKDTMKIAIDMTNSFVKVFGWELQKSFILGGTSRPGATIDEQVMQEAFEAGKELVK